MWEWRRGRRRRKCRGKKRRRKEGWWRPLGQARVEAVALGAAVCRRRAGLELLQGVNLVQRLCLAAFFLQERQNKKGGKTGQNAPRASGTAAKVVRKPHQALLSAGH